MGGQSSAGEQHGGMAGRYGERIPTRWVRWKIAAGGMVLRGAFVRRRDYGSLVASVVTNEERGGFRA